MSLCPDSIDPLARLVEMPAYEVTGRIAAPFDAETIDRPPGAPGPFKVNAALQMRIELPARPSKAAPLVVPGRTATIERPARHGVGQGGSTQRIRNGLVLSI